MFREKLKKFFGNKEYVLLLFFSLALGINSLVLVIQKLGNFYISINDYTKPIFLVYFIFSCLVFGTILFFNEKFNLLKFVEKIVLVYAPSEIILLYGMEKMLCFSTNKICVLINNFVPAFLAFYMILVGYLVIAKRREKFKSDSKKKSLGLLKKIKENKFSLFILILVFSTNIYFGTYHLAEKAVVDEPLWTFDRIPKFWNNVLDGEWYKTRISDKPGITVALISGSGMFSVDPKDYKSISWQGEVYGPGESILKMNFALRFPILLFNSLMIFVFYFFSRKLLGEKTALFSSILIWLSPLLLGISTIINPDSILWIFIVLSVLGYLNYIKRGSNQYLYWAGIFFGLALLTKYIANILFVFFFALIFLEYILNKDKYKSISSSQYFKKMILDYFVMVFFSLLTFFILLPATWVEISKLLDGTILSQAFQKVWVIFVGIISFIFLDIFATKGKLMAKFSDFLSRFKKIIASVIIVTFLLSILLVFINTYGEMKWIGFESILASPKSSYSFGGFWGLFLANFYSLVFGITPLAIASLIFICIKYLNWKDNFSREKLYSIYLIFFTILYYFASTINKVSATTRYQIIIYPLILIISAIGISEFIKMEKIRKFVPEKLSYLIIIFFYAASLFMVRPFYFSYASPLLPEKYVLNLKDMGDGSYEAAKYLNSLPNAKGLRIWTDKRGVCTFFLGNCSSSIDKTKNGEYFDYFVVSSGRESRTTKMTLSRVNGGNTQIIRLDKLYEMEGKDLEWKLEIGGRPNNFVKIVKVDKIP